MNRKQPYIAVLILGFDDREHLPGVLDSALSQSYQNYETIFIDNASVDESLSFVRTHYPHLRTIAHVENIGYAKAYHAALKKVFSEGFDAAVLLNPDVIVDRQWLEHLASSAYADAGIGIAQSKIYLHDYKDERLLNTSGNRINFLGFGFCGDYKKADSPPLFHDREICYPSGCSMLIKKEAYFAAGGLDGAFFAYLEDQDLGWRARLKGYKIIMSSKSVVWHKYRFQSDKRNKLKFFLLERNRLYFLAKNYSTKTILLIFPALLFMEAGVLMHSIANGYFPEKIRSYIGFFNHYKELLVQRRGIQASRIVTDHQLTRFWSPTIEFEEVESLPLGIANRILKGYFSIIRTYI